MNPCISSSLVLSECYTSNIYRVRRRLEITSNIQSNPTCSVPMAPPCATTSRRWKVPDCKVKLGCLLQELIVLWEVSRCAVPRKYTLTFRGGGKGRYLLHSETSRSVRNVGEGGKTPLQGGYIPENICHSQQRQAQITKLPNFDCATIQIFVTR